MKTLILYGSMSGTAAKCAEIIKSKLPDATAADIKGEVPSIKDYGQIVIGGGIYAGKMTGKLRKFIKKNASDIESKPHAFFACCLDPDYSKYLNSNIPEGLLKSAVAAEGFGGETEPERAKGFIKFFLKAMRDGQTKSGKPAPKVDEAKIQAFTDKLSK